MHLALYQPDVPQNTGTILRLCACLGIEAHIIEPAGFPSSDRAFRRAGMDYLAAVALTRHASWRDFESWRALAGSRLILFTTKATASYLRFAFAPNDVLLFGRESAASPRRSMPPSKPGLRSRSAPACVRSMWRWQPLSRQAKRSGKPARCPHRTKTPRRTSACTFKLAVSAAPGRRGTTLLRLCQRA